MYCMSKLLFVPRLNEVAEGGYWIARRPSVRPASITLIVLVRIQRYRNLYIAYNPTPFIQAISDGGHLALRICSFCL